MSESNYLRVAIATDNGDSVDGHFGSCREFQIYQLDSHGYQRLETREASTQGGIDKNDYRAAQVADCQVLYVASIGGPAAAKVIKSGVHPLKDATQPLIDTVLEKLRRVLEGNPPPWLAKRMGQSRPVTVEAS